MLRLRTFGGLTLERDGVRLDDLAAQRKVLALLAVLARYGDAGINRERLMALLWAESDMERARGSLKQMIHSLRRQVDPGVITGTAELQLNRLVMSSDVGDFLDGLAAGNVEQAIQSYGGEFLDGVHVERAPDFSRWQDTQRAELHRHYVDALTTLAQKAGDAGRHSDAIDMWTRCRDADPLRARSVVGLMKALDAGGDRAEALRYALLHGELLRSELGSSPNGEVAALADQLRSAPPSKPQALNTVSALSFRPIPEASTTTSKSLTTRARLTGGQWFLASGLAIAVLAAAVIASTSNRPKSTATGDNKRIVVAMFENRTGDSTLNQLQLLAADWMTRSVATTPGLDVLHPGVLYLQGRDGSGVRTPALELARNNGAQLAIAGGFYRSRDSLFFTASLIDVPSGRVIRALGPFPTKDSDPLGGIEALRQSTSVALASMLDLRISEFVSATAATPRLDAYREFLMGEDLHWRGEMARALPHFAKAGQLDSSFLFVAARMAITAMLANRCDIVDSLAAANADRAPGPTDPERPWVMAAVARCDGDIHEAVRWHRELIKANSRSPRAKWALATAVRRANRPAEAVAILETIDPERDLGWMLGPRKLFFWRELLNAQHAIGDYAAEWKTADRFANTDPGPVMSYFYKARSFVGRNNAAAAVSLVDSIRELSPPPATTGEAVGPIRPATTGWTMYGISEDLLAHGHPVHARDIANRTVSWVDGRSEHEKKQPEFRLMLARALMMAGNHRRSQDLFAELVRDDSANVEYLGGLGRAAALSGDFETARRIASSLIAKPGERGAGAKFLARAQIASAFGDTAKAMALVDSLPYRVHPTDFLLLHSDAALAPLHNHPRFKAFIRPKPID